MIGYGKCRCNRALQKNKNLLEWLDSIILAVAVLSLVFTFAARAIRVDGHSMDPTLHDQQLLIINSLPYQPSHGDIVVIDAYTPHGQTLIKRVIGVAGDTIDIDFTTGTVYRNGEALDEPYTAEPTYTRLDMTFPVTVPEGTIFVMGITATILWTAAVPISALWISGM